MASGHEGTDELQPNSEWHPPRNSVGVGAEAPDLPTVLSEIAWVVHRSAPARSGGPLPTTEIALLKQVLDAPRSTIGELAAALGVRQPNVSAGVRSLEARGFVRREKSITDRRVTQIIATEAGLAEHSEIADAWTEPLREAFAFLTSAERGRLADAAPVLMALHEQLRSRL